MLLLSFCNSWQKKPPEVFYKNGVLRKFTKFTGKHTCQSLFFNKVAGLLIKKEALAQVFSWEFCEIFKNTFFTRHVWTSPENIRKREVKENTYILKIKQIKRDTTVMWILKLSLMYIILNIIIWFNYYCIERSCLKM